MTPEEKIEFIAEEINKARQLSPNKNLISIKCERFFYKDCDNVEIESILRTLQKKKVIKIVRDSFDSMDNSYQIKVFPKFEKYLIELRKSFHNAICELSEKAFTVLIDTNQKINDLLLSTSDSSVSWEEFGMIGRRTGEIKGENYGHEDVFNAIDFLKYHGAIKGYRSMPSGKGWRNFDVIVDQLRFFELNKKIKGMVKKKSTKNIKEDVNESGDFEGAGETVLKISQDFMSMKYDQKNYSATKHQAPVIKALYECQSLGISINYINKNIREKTTSKTKMSQIFKSRPEIFKELIRSVGEDDREKYLYNFVTRNIEIIK